MATKKKAGSAQQTWPPDVPRPEDLDLDVVRDILERAASQLLDAAPGKVSRIAGAALRRYLRGEMPTLDEAFSLRRRGPRVKNKKRDLAIAIAVLRFQRSPAAQDRGAMKALYLGLTEKHGIKSVRNIEEIAKRYKTAADWSILVKRDRQRRRRRIAAARKRGVPET